MAADAVRLDAVSKRFGAVTALHETSLRIAPGEFMTLLGPSGCGKTTLLNLIAGFLEPGGGEIFIGGDLVTEVPVHRREIGIVFQNYALFPHMTVAKNIGYGLRARGVGRREEAERVAEALALVKLDGFADRSPRQLSGGQQQRVALARALVIRPKVLLLDEPFSALDKNLRGSMQVELKEVQRKLGVTTVFVTHDQSEALSLSDRIAVLSEGWIHQIGTPDEIYRRPRDRFVASFVGDVNRLSAWLKKRDGDAAVVLVGGQTVEVAADTLDGVAEGSPVELFARPEALTVGEGACLSGRVAALVYQGDHVDLHIDSPAAAGGRLLARLAGAEAVSRWPVGSLVDVGLRPDGLVAFPAAGGGDDAAR
jgi:putative spermidine/putrescine transport system ATP-binding protein/spermidine/putrescine transport system ATP-binding protein